ncbi:MAG: TorF family putative porin [Sphingomicrobium sp.]
MRLIILSAATALAAFCIPAGAQASDLGSGFAVNGGATLVSDYRFRGISQTNRRPAVQGTISLSHSSGFYATWWGSTIDDYIANGSDSENDFIVGYRHSFGSITIDGGVLYYVYPDHGLAHTDFVEPYVSVAKAFGPVTAKVTANYAPKSSALSVGSGDEDNFYLAGDLAVAVPKTPISLTGHLGHTWGPSYLSIGDEYTDWNLGASLTHGPLTLGLVYVDTSKDSYSPIGRNISGSGVVGSIGVAF